MSGFRNLRDRNREAAGPSGLPPREHFNSDGLRVLACYVSPRSWAGSLQSHGTAALSGSSNHCTSRQEYWSGFHSFRAFPHPGTNASSVDSFPSEQLGTWGHRISIFLELTVFLQALFSESYLLMMPKNRGFSPLFWEGRCKCRKAHFEECFESLCSRNEEVDKNCRTEVVLSGKEKSMGVKSEVKS